MTKRRPVMFRIGKINRRIPGNASSEYQVGGWYKLLDEFGTTSCGFLMLWMPDCPRYAKVTRLGKDRVFLTYNEREHASFSLKSVEDKLEFVSFSKPKDQKTQ